MTTAVAAGADAAAGGYAASVAHVLEAKCRASIKIDAPAENGCTPAVDLAELKDEQLFNIWPRGDEPLKALFLDYDGTLREFEARPELAVPTGELMSLMAALNARKDLSVHIISGRDAKFLIDHFKDYRRITLIAEHERRVAGRFQIWRPTDSSPQSPKWRTSSEDFSGDALEDDWRGAVSAVMNEAVAETPGSHVEEKASSFVWHYREVGDEALGNAQAALLATRVEQAMAKLGVQDVRILSGHKIVEVLHHTDTKGMVMQKICEERAARGQPFKAVLVAGDDVSDESMFEGARKDYLTIKVGSTATKARYRVGAPSELRRFLWKLIS